MHEFTIALNIIDIATEQALQHDAKVIREVEIEIGKASGVVPEALEFALESAMKNTMLENASFVIHEIPVIARCQSCDQTFETDASPSDCPNCGNYVVDLISGKELRVKSLIVE
jgi:hydrogenase nickel incorporation protein HypA/HybF